MCRRREKPTEVMRTEFTEESKKDILDIAIKVSKLSFCKKKQVGAVLMLEGEILTVGFNSMPNKKECCEDKHGNSLNEVIHSESDAIFSAINKGYSNLSDAALFTTLSPCIECAKIIWQSGLKSLYYTEKCHYFEEGINFLEKNGVTVEQVEL